MQRLLKWYNRVSSGKEIPYAGSERATVILLNYRRPWNIRMLVRSALCCACVERILVCDNSGGLLLPESLGTDPRLEIRMLHENRGTAARFEEALSCKSHFFLAIDDDLLLSPEQIHGLFHHLRERPDIPHGVFGEDLVSGEEKVLAITGREGHIDIINRAYAFTRDHVSEFFRMLRCLALTIDEVTNYGDDIILSFSGSGKPLCHDLGPLLSCPTCATDGIAGFKEQGFWVFRAELLGKLADVGNLECSEPNRNRVGRTFPLVTDHG